MSYAEQLKTAAEKNKSIVCMGADPVLEKIPLEGNAEEKISKFYEAILDACISENSLPGAIKPNIAFYAQYGFEGLRALEKVIAKAKEAGLPVILDAKRGDIGKTSAAYAKEVFEFWGADCVTIAPYMGKDSVGPFIEWSEQKGKGVYILNRTSNEGAKELQNLDVGGRKLYELVAEKIIEWGSNASGNVGAVVGATSPKEMESLCSLYAEKGARIPLLIPGVGAQGGSAEEVTAILKKTGMPLELQRINSSSGINFAFEKEKTDDFAGAAVRAIKELNKEIGY